MIPAPPLLAGDPSRLGRYTLVGRLGQGGMGVVYLGRDEDGRLVAIKVIRPELAANPDYLARFRLEVELGRKVNGPFVAEVLDAGFDSERPYLVTAYIEGTTLQASVRERGPMPSSEVAHLAVGMAAALSAIHAAGLVHRDLKPGNVLLSAEGPRVIDFGVARAVRDRSGSLPGPVRPGTAEFMAPEQFEDVEVGPAVDVFAWGGLLVYASTGLPPFGDKAGEGGVDALERRVRYHQPDLGALEHPLRELVGAAMAKLPSGRPTAQALVSRLLASAPLPRGHRAAPGGRGGAGCQAAGDPDGRTGRGGGRAGLVDAARGRRAPRRDLAGRAGGRAGGRRNARRRLGARQGGQASARSRHGARRGAAGGDRRAAGVGLPGPQRPLVGGVRRPGAELAEGSRARRLWPIPPPQRLRGRAVPDRSRGPSWPGRRHARAGRGGRRPVRGAPGGPLPAAAVHPGAERSTLRRRPAAVRRPAARRPAEGRGPVAGHATAGYRAPAGSAGGGRPVTAGLDGRRRPARPPAIFDRRDALRRHGHPAGDHHELAGAGQRRRAGLGRVDRGRLRSGDRLVGRRRALRRRDPARPDQRRRAGAGLRRRQAAARLAGPGLQPPAPGGLARRRPLRGGDHPRRDQRPRPEPLVRRSHLGAVVDRQRRRPGEPPLFQ